MPSAGRLPHRTGIILPSRDRRGRRLPARTRGVIRQVVAEWFSRVSPAAPSLVHLAEWVAREGGQEAIAVLVDGGMELVVGKETS